MTSLGKALRTPICNSDRTEWSSVSSVTIRVTDGRPRIRSPIFFITSMITDGIGRHEVLLSIYHKNFNLREKNSQVMKERENWKMD